MLVFGLQLPYVIGQIMVTKQISDPTRKIVMLAVPRQYADVHSCGNRSEFAQRCRGFANGLPVPGEDKFPVFHDRRIEILGAMSDVRRQPGGNDESA